MDDKKGVARVVFTLILRVKLTGYENERLLWKALEEDITILVNERQKSIAKEYNPTIKRMKSFNCPDGGECDMLAITIRLEEEAYSEFESYSEYPFDKHDFSIKLELNSGKAKIHEGEDLVEVEKTLKFDLYATAD